MAVEKSEWLTCSLTRARLGYIDSVLESGIDAADLDFRQMAMHILKMGGKKLRPSLFLLAVNVGEHYEKDFMQPAAAFELIHIASLYHDDVMDRAELRRNAVSVNAAWGNMNATHTGNYLFSKAISLLSRFDQQVNQVTCQYVADLCLGQLKEAENAYHVDLAIQDHLDIIRMKTASLFELPCKVGAFLGRANAQAVDAMARYSQNIGLAFQLIDDLLDLTGDPVKTGKARGNDLVQGIYGLATLHALASSVHRKPLEDLLLLDHMEATDVTEAIALIQDSGGIAVAQARAAQHIQAAQDAISVLPATPTTESLMQLAQYIAFRNH